MITSLLILWALGIVIAVWALGIGIAVWHIALSNEDNSDL